MCFLPLLPGATAGQVCMKYHTHTRIISQIQNKILVSYFYTKKATVTVLQANGKRLAVNEGKMRQFANWLTPYNRPPDNHKKMSYVTAIYVPMLGATNELLLYWVIEVHMLDIFRVPENGAH